MRRRPPSPDTQPEAGDLARRISEAIEDSNRTLADIAERVGVDVSTLFRWRKGANAPNFIEVYRIAQATGKPIAWFADGELDSEEALTSELGYATQEVGRLHSLLGSVQSELREHLLRRAPSPVVNARRSEP